MLKMACSKGSTVSPRRMNPRSPPEEALLSSLYRLAASSNEMVDS